MPLDLFNQSMAQIDSSLCPRFPWFRFTLVSGMSLNSLPYDKILDRSKLKAFADDENKCESKIEICY